MLFTWLNRRHARWILAILALVLALLAGWRLWGAPTRIALVHYPDFLAVRFLQALPNRFVRVERLEMHRLDELPSYALTLVFGRGLRLDATQLQALRTAAAKGTNIVVEGANNPEFDLTTLQGDALAAVTGYLQHGSHENYRSLYAYARRHLDGKTLFADTPAPAVPLPRNVLFHLDDAQTVTTPAQYQAWLQSRPGWQPGRPRLALLTSVPNPFNASREHIDAIIQAFEADGFDVYPIAAAEQRLAFLRDISPDAVVYLPHGRLAPDQGDAVRQWLQERNIPLFAPLTVFSEYAQWRDSQQGDSGQLLTMSVTLPEFDGAIAPMAIAAQFVDEHGLRVFRAIPAQLRTFVQRVRHTVQLRRQPPQQRRLAIYYFKGPGQSALTAGDLEVLPSLYALLQNLQRRGYRVDGLPDSLAGFEQLLQRRGPNLGPYAKGDIHDFLTHAEPALVPTAQLRQWCQDVLASGLCEQVQSRYGQAPGSYLSTPDAVAVARVPLGNVVLLPQPLPAAGHDTFRLVHGAKQAPPWPYVASYLWTRHVFQADHILHFGTHGSLEFTPWKQVALSDQDWSHALIGDMPHSYLYTTSNVGEAMIAKRRGYAAIVSHLTPPFMTGGTPPALQQLADDLARWQAQGDAVMQAAYAERIQEQAIALALHKEINLPASDAPWNDAQISALAAHLERIRDSHITEGLYTLGTAYTDEAATRTARLIHAADADSSAPEAADKARQWTRLLIDSTAMELDALDNALSGGYTRAGPGGDPVGHPDALPTGRNLVSVDAQRTPSAAAWRVGRQLADDMLQRYRADHDGQWPRKVAFTLWAGDFIHTEGAMIAQILHLLGVEPVRDAAGRVARLQLVPRSNLGRPRIDVVVQTSGQLRDLAASRLALIQQAVHMAAAAQDDDNQVAQGALRMEGLLKQQGLSPAESRRLSRMRVFGGINGSYGANIMEMVEAGDHWRSDTEVAQTYLHNMGAAFGDADDWGAHHPGLFQAALQDADAMLQPLSSNTWGALSLDHVYEFMGGMSAAIRHASGKDAAGYVSDFRNPTRARVDTIEAAIGIEARATVLNPAYVQALAQGGASSAETLAETIRNTYGWSMTRPSAIAPELWDALYDTYVQGAGQSGLQAFFETQNPYALQEITAVMLETARKGHWQPPRQTLQTLADTHADLVARFGASGTEFVNHNRALQVFIGEHAANARTQRLYQQALRQANSGPEIDTRNALVLRKQDDTRQASAQAMASGRAGDASRPSANAARPDAPAGQAKATPQDGTPPATDAATDDATPVTEPDASRHAMQAIWIAAGALLLALLAAGFWMRRKS